MLIRKQLRKSGRKISFWADVANTCNLGRIRNDGCQVFHYAGHADDNYLAFESSVETECGVAEPLEVGHLKSIFEVGGVKTKLVFISSCCSEDSGKAFVAAGVPHVVAVKNGQSIQDQAALQFSILFYEALINDGGRYTVREAFEAALRTVDASPFNVPKNPGDHFLLLPKDGDHDRRIFDTLPKGDFIDMTRHAPERPHIDRAVSSYRGLVGLQKVIKQVVEPKNSCVTITGERGSGKTEMAIQTADYVRDRRHFDAVHWADCSNLVEADARLSNPTPPPFAEYPGALDWSGASGSDLCRLIGIAIGMDFPGPDSEMELHRFLFTKPANGEGQPRQRLEVTTGTRCFLQVLLVLENADALLERGGDARDRLVELLASLCAMGGGERLKLLVTSEHRLLPETHERFRDGSEVEAKVQPLTPVDASKFLRDKLPRNPTKGELRLPIDCPLTDEMIISAVKDHPELRDIINEGHPGTLQRLAPTLLDHIGKKGELKEMAAKYRDEFRTLPRRTRRRQSSSNNSLISHISTMTGSNSSLAPPSTPQRPRGPATVTPPWPMGVSPARTLSHGDAHQRRVGHNSTFLNPDGSPARAKSHGDHPERVTTSPSFHAALQRTCTDGCTCGASVDHPDAYQFNNHRVEAWYPQQWLEQSPPPPSPRQQPQAQPCPYLLRLREIEEQRSAEDLSRSGRAALSAPDPPHMNHREQRAWDAAVAAGVKDNGCLLVWVISTADASADKESHGDGQVNDRRGGSRSTTGLDGGRIGSGGELKSRQLQQAVVDRVPWEFLKDALMEHLTGKLTVPSKRRRPGVGQDDEDEDEHPYGCIGEKVEEGDEEEGEQDDEEGEEEEGSWYEKVDSRRERVLNDHELYFIRGIQEKKQDSLRRSNHHWGAAARGGWGGDGDMIFVEEFAEFCLWWEPLVRTLSLVKPDFEATDPVRVHGFVGRFWADQELKRRTTGTFLFRFSEREPGRLVVSFKERARPNRVKHCLIKVRRGGACCFMEKPRKWYQSLRDLVLETPVLTTLYPDISKEAAFTAKTPPSAQGQAGGRREEAAGQADANSDTAEAVVRQPPVLHQSTPPTYADLERTRTQPGGVQWQGGDAEHGESGGKDDAGTGPQEASSPPTYAEAQRAGDEKQVEEALKTPPEEPLLRRRVHDVLTPEEVAPGATESTLATSLGPGPMTYVSSAHAVEFELQDGSLDGELPVEITITQGLAFVDCGSNRSDGRMFRDGFILSAGATSSFSNAQELLPVACQAAFLPRMVTTDEEIERDILETYRPLTSPDGVDNWTALGKYLVVFLRLLGQREVWVETPVCHFSAEANAIKVVKGGENQSHLCRDVGVLRRWFKGRSSAPRVRFGNTVKHAQASSESEFHAKEGAIEDALARGRRNYSPATGAALPAAGEVKATLVAAGTYEDRELRCDIKEHWQMHVGVGIFLDMTGRGIRSRGSVQLLDAVKISGNTILVLRGPRLSSAAQFPEVDWPCSAEDFCKL
eukprot:g14007.t2